MSFACQEHAHRNVPRLFAQSLRTILMCHAAAARVLCGSRCGISSMCCRAFSAAAMGLLELCGRISWPPLARRHLFASWSRIPLHGGRDCEFVADPVSRKQVASLLEDGADMESKLHEVIDAKVRRLQNTGGVALYSKVWCLDR